jgi:hypothetical protein
MVGWSPLPDAEEGAGKISVKIIRFLTPCQAGKPFRGLQGEGRREKGEGANGGGAVCAILPKISGRIL